MPLTELNKSPAFEKAIEPCDPLWVMCLCVPHSRSIESRCGQWAAIQSVFWLQRRFAAQVPK
jgi:hypothetical protein